MTTKTILILILLSALVNWLTRISPYLLVRVTKLPQKVVAFLTYLPVSIMFAMVLSSIVQAEVGSFPQPKWVECLALLPTGLVLWKSKNIVWTVLVGVTCVAALRYLWG